MKPKPPCKDCKDRTVGCHSKCKPYLDFKQKFNKWQSEIKEEKYQRYLSRYGYQNMQKYRRNGKYKAIRPVEKEY